MKKTTIYRPEIKIRISEEKTVENGNEYIRAYIGVEQVIDGVARNYTTVALSHAQWEKLGRDADKLAQEVTDILFTANLDRAGGTV